MIAAGIGSKRGVTAQDVLAAIDAALERVHLSREDLKVIATPAVKGGEAGIAEAAALLGLPLVLIPQGQLEAMAERTQTHSERVVALLRIPSAAETAALAACGLNAHLLGPRLALGSVTCALARSGALP
ncbi:cobalamin biosynthesis protein [Azorhizobium caulinodans ORS 571]|uniref:Cobalamin biosynthesis protein n=1 Tax=Azorhizobium caulinodans (strain ATCC 43989 / DSM 5975 / JCM 20966 / LMG 6465 / NBRC 14845 / NCIMB 13405 / ORS 571) TaxID=438753 RepID=A8IKS0_AZOC5|nr:cobalamin biosynthesis protein [Azorhizobium caulinodans]BAF89941.1 cobalamin biosynthesis protein [Azorhizobium caulinodans ORS 571]